MGKKKHLLSDLWENYPEALSNTYSRTETMPIGNILADLFSIGPHYFYIINLGDSSLKHVSESTLHIHGLSDYPPHLGDIIDLIHEDDLNFVLEAEKMTLEKMKEIGFQHQLKLKTSYCFRMRVADGSYHLFHHQAIHLSKDQDGRLVTALNIHTDINQITSSNNNIVLIQGIGDRKDYCQIDLSQHKYRNNAPKLSRREMEILQLLAKGLTSKQMAEQLFIAEATVRVHRKNLLKKTNTMRCSQLIKQCIEFGLL